MPSAASLISIIAPGAAQTAASGVAAPVDASAFGKLLLAAAATGTSPKPVDTAEAAESLSIGGADLSAAINALVPITVMPDTSAQSTPTVENTLPDQNALPAQTTPSQELAASTPNSDADAVKLRAMLANLPTDIKADPSAPEVPKEIAPDAAAQIAAANALLALPKVKDTTEGGEDKSSDTNTDDTAARAPSQTLLHDAASVVTAAVVAPVQAPAKSTSEALGAPTPIHPAQIDAAAAPATTPAPTPAQDDATAADSAAAQPSSQAASLPVAKPAPAADAKPEIKMNPPAAEDVAKALMQTTPDPARQAMTAVIAKLDSTPNAVSAPEVKPVEAKPETTKSGAPATTPTPATNDRVASASPQAQAASPTPTPSEAGSQLPAHAAAPAPAQVNGLAQPTDTGSLPVIAGAQAQAGTQIDTTMPVVVLRATHPTANDPGSLPTSQIGVAIARQFKQGSNQFEIRLDPPELGRIDVRMEINHQGRVTATLSADRPDTLDLLQRDSRSLHRALSEAGLDTSPDSLNFTMRERRDQQQSNADTNDDQSSSARTRADATPASLPVYTASVAPGRLDLRV